jgi:HD-like signal output (HDOD) protein
MSASGEPAAERSHGDDAPSSLAERLRVGPLPAHDGTAILAALFARLAERHRTEGPHGALGPETVVVGRPGPGAPAAQLKPPRDEDRVPSPGLAAPEWRPDRPPSTAADVWAAGTLAFLALAGRPPVDPAGGVEALALAAPAVPLGFAALVDRMRSPDERDRPSAEEAAALADGFRHAIAPPAPEPARDPAPVPPRRAAGPLGFLGALFRRRPRPAPRPAVAAAPPRPEGALALLCLEDFEPIPRADAIPLDRERLERAIAATLADTGRPVELPAFPWVALQVVDLARRGDVGANDLVRLVNRDPVLIARVLRIANSAYANRGIEVTSARDAVIRLGLREVAAAAAAAAARSLFVADDVLPDPELAEAGARLWRYALTSALAASWLAMECGADDGRAFLGGMLHDLGKTIALRRFVRLAAADRLEGLPPAAALGPILEATHVELGERTARAWNLPAAAIRACAEHHRCPTGPAEDRELHLVRVVSGMASLQIEPDWSLARTAEVAESARLLGFDRHRVRATVSQVRLFASRAEALAAAAG